MIRRQAFTLIEVAVSITIVAMIVLPITTIVIEYIREATGGDLSATAMNLAQREIGIIDNLPYTDSTLAAGYDHLTSPYVAGYPFELRRTVSAVTGASVGTSNLRKVVVTVYPIGFGEAGGCGGGGGGCGGGGCGGGGGGGGGSNKLIEIDTYVINNVTFGAGSAGGTASSTEASAFSLTTPGSWSGKTVIQGIGTRNTRTTGNITVTALYVWSNTSGRTLTTVVMRGGQTVYGGSFTLPVTTSKPASPNITLQKTGIMNYSASADTSSSFTFSTNFSTGNTFSVVYKMSDGSEFGPYTWTK